MDQVWTLPVRGRMHDAVGSGAEVGATWPSFYQTHPEAQKAEAQGLAHRRPPPIPAYQQHVPKPDAATEYHYRQVDARGTLRDEVQHARAAARQAGREAASLMLDPSVHVARNARMRTWEPHAPRDFAMGQPTRPATPFVPVRFRDGDEPTAVSSYTPSLITKAVFDDLCHCERHEHPTPGSTEPDAIVNASAKSIDASAREGIMGLFR